MSELMDRGLEIAKLHVEQRLGLTLMESPPEGCLVAQSETETIFILVRVRETDTFGHPLDAVTPAKLAWLRREGAQWMRHRRDVSRDKMRVDAIAVLTGRGDELPQLEHLERIF